MGTKLKMMDEVQAPESDYKINPQRGLCFTGNIKVSVTIL